MSPYLQNVHWFCQSYIIGNTARFWRFNIFSSFPIVIIFLYTSPNKCLTLHMYLLNFSSQWHFNNLRGKVKTAMSTKQYRQSQSSPVKHSFQELQMKLFLFLFCWCGVGKRGSDVMTGVSSLVTTQKMSQNSLSKGSLNNLSMVIFRLVLLLVPSSNMSENSSVSCEKR